jgi:hypothetical protein
MPTQLPADAGGPNRMEAVPVGPHGLPGGLGDLQGLAQKFGRAAHPDQVKAPAAPPAGQPETYVRLQVQYDNGKLTVNDAKEVEGPLLIPDSVGSGLVYEVTLDGRRIGLGQLPDANRQRAFTNIDRPEWALGHGQREFSTFDFQVRVPSTELTSRTLPNIQIALHRLGEPPAGPVGPTPLPTQLGSAAVELATLHGVAVDQLNPAAQKTLSSILGRRP